MRVRHLIRVSGSLVLLLLFAAYVSGFLPFRFLDQLENYAYDARLRVTMPSTVDSRIVIVDVDDRSLQRIGQWPWPRDTVARMLDNLFTRYHAKLVAFDMTFPEADRDSDLALLDRLENGPLKRDSAFQKQARLIEPALERDRIFAASLQHRPVVLGYVFEQKNNFSARHSEGELPPPVATDLAVHFPKLILPQARGYIGNLPVLSRAAMHQGFFSNPFVDQDGVFRRIGLLQEYRGNLYVSLDLAVLRALQNSAPVKFVFDADNPSDYDNAHLDKIRIGAYTIPVNRELSALVPYRGRVRSFPYVSAANVLDGSVPAAILRDAIVYIGATAAGENDLRSTPVGNVFPGVEIHADFLSGVLDHRIKSAQPQYAVGAELLLLVIIAIILTWIFMTRSILVSGAVALALFILVIAGNLLIWQYGQFVLPLAAPMLFLVILFVLHSLYGYFIESRSKRHLSRMFSQYVPPELVKEMDRRPARYSMESGSRELTVLFSDLRGFTSISETLNPKDLSQLMNEFLTSMTRVIHAHRGTIDKYMGDAVMAFWGAPLPDPDHVRHGLEAAFDMLVSLKALNPEFASRGWPELHIGIGLNSGVMRVGDMGSEFRRAYTVMGDAVNLGERFQGLTREYGVEIVCGESVRTALPDFAFLELDWVRVHGREQTVACYQPLGPKQTMDAAAKGLLNRYKQALAWYRAGDWDVAEREFFALSQAQPDRVLYRLYLDRIAQFRNRSTSHGV